MGQATDWQSFYIMVGGAAAALTGLIFVAVSLHTGSIMENVLHRDRAWASVALLMSQLFIAMAILAPAQPVRLLGLEIGLIAAFWVARTLRIIRQLGPAMRSFDRPNARWQIEWFAWMIWVVALVAGRLSLIFEVSVGFQLLAIAMVGMFGFAIWSSWVLISEVDG